MASQSRAYEKMAKEMDGKIAKYTEAIEKVKAQNKVLEKMYVQAKAEQINQQSQRSLISKRPPNYTPHDGLSGRILTSSQNIRHMQSNQHQQRIILGGHNMRPNLSGNPNVTKMLVYSSEWLFHCSLLRNNNSAYHYAFVYRY